jgi:hypothetical protein
MPLEQPRAVLVAPRRQGILRPLLRGPIPVAHPPLAPVLVAHLPLEEQRQEVQRQGIRRPLDPKPLAPPMAAE